MTEKGGEVADDRVLARILDWAEATPDITAVILTSTRARDDAPVDEFSDYDVILASTDAGGRAADLSWQSIYRSPLVRWEDEGEVLGHPTSFRGVIYDDHVKVDYTIWPSPLLDAVAAQKRLPPALDHGYRVLLDKGDATRRWPVPTFTAYVLTPPPEAEYRALVEQFWWDASYVVKAVHRGELFFAASFMLEHDLKLLSLRRMIEWRIAAERDWSFAPSPHGRGLERHLDAETVRRLDTTYARLDADALWDALFALAALFGEAARDVGSALGYAYPQEIADVMTARFRTMRSRR